MNPFNPLAGVTASPTMGMGMLGTSMEGFNPLTPMMPVHQPDLAGLLGAMQGVGDSQSAPAMQPLPGRQVQAGGGQFNPAYMASQYTPEPTAQALSGLLGGIYGTV